MAREAGSFVPSPGKIGSMLEDLRRIDGEREGKSGSKVNVPGKLYRTNLKVKASKWIEEKQVHVSG